MEDESKKTNLSQGDQDYLNDNGSSTSMDNMLGMAAIGNALSGLSESQSSEAIILDEVEIKEIKKKKEQEDELTSNQQMKLSIHDIQSGKYKTLFQAVNNAEASVEMLDRIRKDNKLKQNNDEKK
jgi:hypothetical protein